MSERFRGRKKHQPNSTIHRKDFDSLWPSPWSLYERPKPIPLDRDIERGLTIQFVTKGERKWEEELAISEQIYRRELEGLPCHEAFQKYLSAMIRVSDIHLPHEKANKPRSVGVLGGVQGALIDLLAMEHAENVSDGYLVQMKDQEQMLLETQHPDKWYLPKVRNLIMGIERWQRTYPWIELLQKRLGHLESQLDPRELQERCSQIAEKISEDRTYGVRNCYFESPLFLKPNQAFTVFDERLGLGDELDENDIPNDLIACIGLGERPRGKIETFPVREEYSYGVKWRGIGTTFTDNMFSVDQSGEIRSTVLATVVPLRYAFERKGALLEYELWRAFMLMRIYDLTRHADIVRRMPQLNEAEKEIAKGEGGVLGIGRKVKKLDYVRLILPRIKDGEDQGKWGTSGKNGEQKRFVDRHHVTWFVRRLPEGYHPTERAVSYAQEHNITLVRGETIVREHYRGREREEAAEKPTRAFFRKK